MMTCFSLRPSRTVALALGLGLAIGWPCLVSPAHGAVNRTPIRRPQVLVAPPAGYQQLAIPPRYARPVTPGSRTVEFSATRGGRPGTLAVTLTEAGDPVAAFVSGSLQVALFQPAPVPGQPGARPRATRISTWNEFWDVLWERIRKCKEKYPPGDQRNKCIDDAIIETLGEAVGL